MHYEKPEFTEVRMDAEIGAYQNDFDPERRPVLVEPAEAAPEPHIEPEG